MRSSLFATTLLSLAANLTALPTTQQLLAPFNFIAASTSSQLAKRNVGGVRLCTGTDWTGTCNYVIWPLEECIALNGYAGNVLSFRPDEDTECYLMQGRCDANEQYADLINDSTEISDLSTESWIASANSYVCMTPLVL